MRQRRVKTVKVIIGYKADNTPIKRPFYGRMKETAAGRAAKWMEVHGTPAKNADILTVGGLGGPLAAGVQEAGRVGGHLPDHLRDHGAAAHPAAPG